MDREIIASFSGNNQKVSRLYDYMTQKTMENLWLSLPMSFECFLLFF